jgi:hypothetical protein
MISVRPSTTRASSSSEARARREPIRSTDSVRIWLILIHDLLVKPLAVADPFGNLIGIIESPHFSVQA